MKGIELFLVVLQVSLELLDFFFFTIPDRLMYKQHSFRSKMQRVLFSIVRMSSPCWF